MVEVEWLSFGFSLMALILTFTFSLVAIILTNRSNQSQFGALINLVKSKTGFVKIKNIGRGCAYLVTVNFIDVKGKIFSSYIVETLLTNQEKELKITNFRRIESYNPVLTKDEKNNLLKEKCDTVVLAYVKFLNEYKQSKFERFFVIGENENYEYQPILRRQFNSMKRLCTKNYLTNWGIKREEKRIYKLVT